MNLKKDLTLSAKFYLAVMTIGIIVLIVLMIINKAGAEPISPPVVITLTQVERDSINNLNRAKMDSIKADSNFVKLEKKYNCGNCH